MISECTLRSLSVRDKFLSRLNRVISVPVRSSLAGPGSGKEVTCMSLATNFRGDFNDRLMVMIEGVDVVVDDEDNDDDSVFFSRR